eukprot:1739651-Prymnesium_polylepis.1
MGSYCATAEIRDFSAFGIPALEAAMGSLVGEYGDGWWDEQKRASAREGPPVGMLSALVEMGNADGACRQRAPALT